MAVVQCPVGLLGAVQADKKTLGVSLCFQTGQQVNGLHRQHLGSRLRPLKAKKNIVEQHSCLQGHMLSCSNRIAATDGVTGEAAAKHSYQASTSLR